MVQKNILSFLDVSLVNAHIAITHVPEFSHIYQEELRMEIVKALVRKYKKQMDNASVTNQTLSRLDGYHYEIENIRGRCPVCAAQSIRSVSSYSCKKCQNSLCLLKGCWNIYHTDEELKK